MKYLIYLNLALLLLTGCQTTVPEKTQEPALTSWNNTAVKQKIIDFVIKTTDPASADFVPAEDRIAVFDNDGTLWNEKPLYIPLEYEIAYIKAEYPNKPEWEDNHLYTELANDNLAVLKEYSSFDLINQLFAAHDGQEQQDYQQSAYHFLSTNNHPQHQRPFKEMVFQPMEELVQYLQDHDFDVFIVTGGEIGFTRSVSSEIYGIPPQNVVGSNVQLVYHKDDQKLYRTGKIVSANDKQVKPANIELHIGKKPIFAAGNSDGDYEMMEYTLSGHGPSMAILVHHDDEEREYSYMHGTEKAVEDAKTKGWHLVSMKDDFKTIFK